MDSPSSTKKSSSSQAGSSHGGGRGGRGHHNKRYKGKRGGRGRGGGRNNWKGNKNNDKNNNNNNDNNNNNNRSNKQDDEALLIRFMPYIRNENPKALEIHQKYGNNNKNQKAFMQSVKAFLDKQQQQQQQQNSENKSPPTKNTDKNNQSLSVNKKENKKSPAPKQPVVNKESVPPDKSQKQEQPKSLEQEVSTLSGTPPLASTPDKVTGNNNNNVLPRPPPGLSLQPMNQPPTVMPNPADIISSSLNPITGAANDMGTNIIQSMQQQQHEGPHALPPPQIQPPNVHAGVTEMSSILQFAPPGLASLSLNDTATPPAPTQFPVSSPTQPKSPGPAPSGTLQQGTTDHNNSNDDKESRQPKQQHQQPRVFQPKRLWTRLDQQPGKLFANDVGTDPSLSNVVNLRPRQELTARWILPLDYLRNRMAIKHQKQIQQRGIAGSVSLDSLTIRDALVHLTVGLFRRGCMENGTTASIISKEILAPSPEQQTTSRTEDYPYQVVQGKFVHGTVPFYAPRTPGHVLFRLYWQDEPIYTLATGPTLCIGVGTSINQYQDVEPTLRFILSNFKSKKGSATSLSSLNALANVLESFLRSGKQQQQHNSHHNHNNNNNAGRAAWGCICESRKVLEVCALEYCKTREKLTALDDEIQKLKTELESIDKQQDDDNNDDNEVSGDNENQGETNDENEARQALEDRLREKTHALMGGRAGNERKWKDSQLAFAAILKPVVSNPSATLLFRRELIAKIQLEYELWCPLCESFAPSPFNNQSEKSQEIANLCVDFNQFPHQVTPAHFQQCSNSRKQMQQETLNFIPNRTTLYQLLMGDNNNNNTTGMDRKAVETLNRLSGAMGQLYQEKYVVSQKVYLEREAVRSHVERIVAQCDAFPKGTRVVVFGSAANGFGSGASDLDMCLQLPPGTTVGKTNNNDDDDEPDKTGAKAMAQLADLFQQGGMKDVDTVRLTARIPVIRFHCPRPSRLNDNNNDNSTSNEDSLLECDLSMQNPLACLNTSLLLTYSQIHPVTRVLASIIKRWAKARDINNPSQHSLSSYGYILMLIHFMTFHKRAAGGGLLCPITQQSSGNNNNNNAPLLPNLFWVDGTWLTEPPHVPYREYSVALPHQLMPHPLEPDVTVNTYFFRLGDERLMAEMQRRFPYQDLSLALLLASFFRYYAYEFDYKRHIVSVHSTANRGVMEREIKAELFGWRIYSTTLAIEDPFEVSYDVAHVLKGFHFHRLRNEFAMAYTKIVNVAGGTTTGQEELSGMDLINLICEELVHEDEEAAADT